MKHPAPRGVFPALTTRGARAMFAAIALLALMISGVAFTAGLAWTAPAWQVMPRVVPDGLGGAYVAWIAESGSDHLVYAQHYTGAGDVVAGWPADGVLISSAGGVFDNISIISDGAGGAYVAWDAGSDFGGVAFRYLSAAGPSAAMAPIVTVQPGLLRGGIAAGAQPLATPHPGSPSPGPGTEKFRHAQGDSRPVIASDGNGGVFFAWQHASQISGNTLLVRHYNEAGAADPQWPQGIAFVYSYSVWDPRILADGSGGAYLAWTDGYPIPFVEINHVTASGALAPGWAINGKRVCAKTVAQAAPGLASDGAGGVIVTWADARSLTHEGVFAQHFSAGGDANWDSAGVSVCSQPALYGPNRYGGYTNWSGRVGPVVADGSGGAFITWTDQRGGTESGLADIYAQHIGPTGAPAVGWPLDGKAICAESGDQVLPSLTIDGAGGAYISWLDNGAGGSAWTLRYHRFDAAGQMVFGEPANGGVISVLPSASWPPVLAAEAGHAAIAGWVEMGDATSTVRIARLPLQGASGGSVATALLLTSDRNVDLESHVVTLKASVTPRTATGTVEFMMSGHRIAIVPLVAGVATTPLTLTSAGTRTITAVYSGDATYEPSGGFVVQQTNPRLQAGLTLYIPENPTLVGRTITIAAHLRPEATGNVRFSDDGVPLGTVPVANSFAVLTVPATTTGVHNLRVEYSGDTLCAPVRDSLLETIYIKFPTAVFIYEPTGPNTTRDVDLTAQVIPKPPDGELEFADDSGYVARVPLTGGMAAMHYHAPGFGVRHFFARYAGNVDYAPGAKDVLYTFLGLPTSLTLNCSATPIPVGVPVTLSASVQPAGVTGAVRFTAADVVIGTVPLDHGLATLTLPFMQTSAFELRATYLGDTLYSAALQALYVEVLGGLTTTRLTSSANPMTSGSLVRFTCNVTPRTSEGSVVFWLDRVASSSVPVTDGVASLTLPALPDGDHMVTAEYSGGTHLRFSASEPIMEHVSPAFGPFTRVLSPNNGESWRVGTPATIRWDAAAADLAPVVSIYLARTDAFNWELLAENVPNTGSYTWLVSGPGTNVAKAEVMSATIGVFDDNGEIGSDTSDLPFSIYDVTTEAVVTRFEAVPVDLGVRVSWALSATTPVAHLELQRAPADAGPWTAVAAKVGNEPGAATIEDRDVVPGNVYWYRLLTTTASGESAILGPVKSAAGAPRETALGKAWPNPSTGPMTLEFSLARSTPVELDVLDLQGRVRSRLAHGEYAPGHYRVDWDGRDDGVKLSPGIYYVRLDAAGKAYVSRVVIIR